MRICAPFITEILILILQVSQLTGQVAELQRSLSALQEETDCTITKLRQELQDKANIVETLQQQIRMKMFLNLTSQKNPMMTALADLQGESKTLTLSVFLICANYSHENAILIFN